MRECTVALYTASEEAQERAELDLINSKSYQNREAEDKRIRNRFAAQEAEEAALAKRISTYVMLFCAVCIWITGVAALLILAKTGAIAGWLMQFCVTAWTGLAGYRVGKIEGAL